MHGAVAFMPNLKKRMRFFFPYTNMAVVSAVIRAGRKYIYSS